MSEETIAGGVPAAAAAAPVATPDAGAPPAPVVVSGAAPAAAETPAAPVAPPAAPAGAGTILGTAETTPAEGEEAKDWRTEFAGDDKAKLKTLERFKDPAALAKSYFELQAKVSAGQVPKGLPKDATPEQVAEYRAEHGIPETADAYEAAPANGIVFGDEDKPALDSFKAHAHSRNWTPQQFGEAIDWYAEQQEQMGAAREAADGEFRAEARGQIAEMWGASAKANVNVVQNLLTTHAPAGLADKLLGGRTADGRLIGDHPEMLAFLFKAANDINPGGTVVPAGHSLQGKAAADELNDLRKMMADQGSDYWRGPKKDEHQARYRELLKATGRA